MKKFFLLLMAIGAITLVSCNDKAKDSSASESASESEEVVNGVKYENKDLGYSVVLPEGIKPQNDDAEMEKSRGGKLFIGDGCQIDVTAREMDYQGSMTPEESIKQSIELAKAINENAEVKAIDKVSFVSTSKDESSLVANYECQKNGKCYNIHILYPVEKKDAFDKDVDAIIKSLKTK